MAQKVNVLLIDDIDGSEADETVTFALDGKTYEIDLTEKNAAKLRKALEGYRVAARRVGKATPARKGAAPAAASGTPSAEIREWALKEGIPVTSRGRIPADIREAYEKANS